MFRKKCPMNHHTQTQIPSPREDPCQPPRYISCSVTSGSQRRWTTDADTFTNKCSVGLSQPLVLGKEIYIIRQEQLTNYVGTMFLYLSFEEVPSLYRKAGGKRYILIRNCGVSVQLPNTARSDAFHSIPFNGSKVPQHSVCRISTLFVGFWSDFFKGAVRFLLAVLRSSLVIINPYMLHLIFYSYAIDIIGIFHWQNPFGRIMTLRSTQPLTEISTRNISWGVKVVGA